MSNLTILPRSDWRARDHKSAIQIRDPSTIHELFFHWPGETPRSWATYDTKTDEAVALRNFQNYHMDGHGWSDIGYNHMIGGMGKIPRVWTARGAQYVPAAQLAHNKGTLACLILVGPANVITRSLADRMRSYIRWAEHYTGNRLTVRPHSAVTSTDCPGPKLRTLITSGALNIH